MHPLISVIVPIYNVGAYLSECLDSILTQSYLNLEILLIDDGSTDACPQICDRYARKDNRIRVVHQKNGGLSHARNVGMELASGSFLSFIDADDTIRRNFIEMLYTACFDTGASLSMCTFYRDAEFAKKAGEPYRVCGSYEASRALFLDSSGFYGIVCNKLYKRELFENIRFPEGKIHEDEFVVYRIFWKCGKCAIVDLPLYFYRKRYESISEQPFSQKNMDKALAYQEKIQFYSEEQAAELVTLAQASYCYFLRTNIRNICRLRMPEKHWGRALMAAYWFVLKSKDTSWKKKISLSLFMLFPWGYQRLKDVYRWILYR